MEEFRQFRRKVRGSREYLPVGIDVAKEKHYAFFGTVTGKTLLRRLVFENNKEGFRAVKTKNALRPRSSPSVLGRKPKSRIIEIGIM